jgi:hypothetical protein
LSFLTAPSSDIDYVMRLALSLVCMASILAVALLFMRRMKERKWLPLFVGVPFFLLVTWLFQHTQFTRAPYYPPELQENGKREVAFVVFSAWFLMRATHHLWVHYRGKRSQ